MVYCVTYLVALNNHLVDALCGSPVEQQTHYVMFVHSQLDLSRIQHCYQYCHVFSI